MATKRYCTVGEQAKNYLRTMALGLNKIYLCSRKKLGTDNQMLLGLGFLTGSSGRIRHIGPALKTEVVQATHSTRSLGVTKPQHLLVGFNMTAVSPIVFKKASSLEDLIVESNTPEKVDNSKKTSLVKAKPNASEQKMHPNYGGLCETHYVYNYWLSGRSPSKHGQIYFTSLDIW